MPGVGDYRPAVGCGRTIGRHCGWSAHLMSALTRLWTVIFLVADLSGSICTAGPTQWRNYGYQLTAAETSVPFASYRLDTPLSFVSQRRRPCVWYAGHGRREATSDRLIASAKRPVTIIPLTIGLLSDGRVSLDSRKSRNSFPGIEKKNWDSRLSSLVNIPSPALVAHNYCHANSVN